MECQTIRHRPLRDRAAKLWGSLLHVHLAAQLLCIELGDSYSDMVACRLTVVKGVAMKVQVGAADHDFVCSPLHGGAHCLLVRFTCHLLCAVFQASYYSHAIDVG